MSRTRPLIGLACLLLAGCGPDAEPPSSEVTASLPAPSAGISRSDAIEIARDAATEMVGEEWQVGAVSAGPLADVVPEFDTYEWARDLPAQLRVWRVGLMSGELSALVVTDFMDGRVYGVVVGIAN